MEEIYYCFLHRLNELKSYEILSKSNLPADYFLPRYRFAHKGDFGHALHVTGSYGKAGAAILCAKACMRTGCGLLTMHVPERLYDIMQTSFPEAMVETGPDEGAKYLCEDINDIEKYDCIAAGPGLGTAAQTKESLAKLLKTNASLAEPKAMVLDADALNILADIPNFEKMLAPNTILTPHPKEFERLFGEFKSYEDKVLFMQKFTIATGIVIVLKGGVTAVSTPNGKIYFNIHGNPGMATAGSGDVLTGIICGLLAQRCNNKWYGKYRYAEAAKIGVYLHALSGDFARDAIGENSLIASDLIDNIHKSIAVLAAASKPILGGTIAV